MEVEKRKKRVIVEEEGEGERLKKLKGKDGGCSSGVGGVVVPKEEEVEEFFAILRRMKVAVEYFGEKGRGGKEWREALEQVQVAVDDDGENADDVGEGEAGVVVKEKNDEQGITNEAFDLNALAPEAAESGGA